MAKRKLTVEVPLTPEAFVAGLAGLPVSGGVAGDGLVVDLLPDAGLQRCRLSVRGGTATWVQRVSVQERSLTARMVQGDFSRLEISWTAEEDGTGATAATMVADFGTNVPHFAGAIESATGRVLARVALAQARAVAGVARVTGGASALADPEPVLTAPPRATTHHDSRHDSQHDSKEAGRAA